MKMPLPTGERNADVSQQATLTTEQVEAVYGFPAATLRDWRYRGRGPRYFKTSGGKSGTIRYRRADVDAWIEERLVDPAAAA